MYGGVGSEGDLYVGLFEQVSDEVSLPMYVKVAHFGAGVCVRVFVIYFLSRTSQIFSMCIAIQHR